MTGPAGASSVRGSLTALAASLQSSRVAQGSSFAAQAGMTSLT